MSLLLLPVHAIKLALIAAGSTSAVRALLSAWESGITSLGRVVKVERALKRAWRGGRVV